MWSTLGVNGGAAAAAGRGAMVANVGGTMFFPLVHLELPVRVESLATTLVSTCVRLFAGVHVGIAQRTDECRVGQDQVHLVYRRLRLCRLLWLCRSLIGE